MAIEQTEDEKRKIDRVRHPVNGVMVVCDTQEKLYVQVQDVSPLGLGVCGDVDSPDILGKDVIIVTETLIMYADVARQERQEDGRHRIGLAAKKFTDDVLQYLFHSIAVNDDDNDDQEEER